MRYNEISHFSHPQHKLRFEYNEFPFKCNGCKEIGIGSRYKCSSSNNICDYDLHTQCALIPTTTLCHPFYTKCTFQFMSSPPGGTTARYCNACEKDVNGFVYHCKSCGFDLHPCCAKLPSVLEVDGGEVKLYLYRKVSSACYRCGRKGRSWSYRTSCTRYNLHVACVREMLVENWYEVYVGGCGKAGGGGRKVVDSAASINNNVVPGLKNTLLCGAHNNNGRRKEKVKQYCEIAGLAVQIVVSAVLGDPTALIVGVVGAFMSRA